MGRKKIIADNDVLTLVKRYIHEEYVGNPNELKLSKIAEYIRANGHPNYAVESLRRNPLVREYIGTLKQVQREEALSLISAYRTLDVETFLDTHRTRASLKCALVELDGYYCSIAAAAAELSEKHKALDKKWRQAAIELGELHKQSQELSSALEAVKKENKALLADKQALKSIVEDYVYPDIAKKLLAADGLIPEEESSIDTDKLGSMLITGSTRIEKHPVLKAGSNVVEAIFNKFEG